MPGWMRGRASGWVTAEYGMLPALDRRTRKARDAARGRLDGRTVEIQRLIGRVAARHRRPRRPRRAHGLGRLRRDPGRRRHALRGHQRRATWRCTARSRGLVDGRQAGRAAARRHGRGGQRRHRRRRAACSTCRTWRTSRAEVDMNVVMTGDGRFVEVQGTAEGMPFAPRRPRRAARAGRAGHPEIRALQLRACAPAGDLPRLAERPQGARARAPAGGSASRRWPGYDAPVEDGATFDANARIKARAAPRAAPAGATVVADDSGHRGRGARRRARHPLARATAATASTTRAASRTCWRELGGAADRRAASSACSSRSRPTARAGRRGRVEGTIATAPRGAGGFGYDPVFVPPARPARWRDARRREGRALAPGPRRGARCAPRWSPRERRRRAGAPRRRRRPSRGAMAVLIAVKVALALVTGSVGRPGRGRRTPRRAAADDRRGVRGPRRGRPAARRHGRRAGGRRSWWRRPCVAAFASLRTPRRRRSTPLGPGIAGLAGALAGAGWSPRTSRRSARATGSRGAAADARSLRSSQATAVLAAGALALVRAHRARRSPTRVGGL